jgi:hypothetical protein
MAMSNAERQRRFIQRLKARAAAAGERPAAKRVTNADLVGKLDKEIEALWAQGTAHVACRSPNTIQTAVIRIERLLVEHGIMPKSERWRNPKKHARIHHAQWDKMTSRSGSTQNATAANTEALATIKALDGLTVADLRSAPLEQLVQASNLLQHLHQLADAEVNDRVERTRPGKG